MNVFKKIMVGCVAAIIILMIGLNVYVYAMGERYVINSIETLPKAQTAIILGAAVTQNGVPGAVLKDRVLTAIDLYKQGIVNKILMSGANDTVDYNEVNPVRKLLIQNGIPAEDIFLDHAGFDTYSTMYRAKHVFKVESAIIVTQAFHLPRAVYLARQMGITSYGLPADKGHYSYKNYLRELLARPNAVIDVLIHRQPKFVGSEIPITGDGTTT